MRTFISDAQREGVIEWAARPSTYLDFCDDITIKEVIGTLVDHYGYDNLFALEVINRMKELKRL